MTDVKAAVTSAQTSRLDGAGNISKAEYQQIKSDFVNGRQSSESVKWLETNHRALHAAITSDLDYEGYTGTYIGALNSTRSGGELKEDARRRSQRKRANLPPIKEYRADGLHKDAPTLDPIGRNIGTNEMIEGAQTGRNYTKVSGNKLAVSDGAAREARQGQKDFTTKMSGVTGLDLTNPPSVKAAKSYFQTMASNGASQKQIQKEYGSYLDTFYKHPGGVSWNGTADKPGKLDPKNLDATFRDQPITKDGKRLINCAGYAGLTENVLGGINEDGKPMFEIKHGGNPDHVVTGVFPRGGDPKSGFVVDNHTTRNFNEVPVSNRDYAATRDPESRKNYLLRTHLGEKHPAIRGGYTYGETLQNMQPVKA
jgi:hypothetical protein